jgi:hypothetical protein
MTSLCACNVMLLVPGFSDTFAHSHACFRYTSPCPVIAINRLRRQDLMRVVPVLHPDAVLCHDLDEHALEVDGHPPLQLVCAHFKDSEALL